MASLALAATLGGCVEPTTPGGQATALDVTGAIARGDMHSPRTAAVALASVDGAPDIVVTRFRQDLVAEAATRQITLAEPPLARYYLRGYLDAYPTETGTSVHYVWDLFDSAKQRSRRLDDAFDIPGPGADGSPWDHVDEATLAGMAARSADAIAIALSGMPEATSGSQPATGISPGPSASTTVLPPTSAVN